MDLPFHSFRPDTDQLLNILRRKKAERPVLFEFIIDPGICRLVAPQFGDPEPGSFDFFRMIMEAFRNLGYDAAPVYAWETDTLNFEKGSYNSMESRSQNQGALITDRSSFERYRWPDPGKGNYEVYDRLARELPDGMKLLACSNGGILENATDIVGFENLCILALTDPDLTGEIFHHVGSRLLEYYTIVAPFEGVGACMVNDDWGFKTQTMFPPEMMQEYVFPYTRKIVSVIHDCGKPAILHSCGNLKGIMEVVIEDLSPDGKHSFEDEIYPVEEAYEWWHDRIAIMGGIDMDFLCRSTPEQVYGRALELLEKTFDRGGFALGSGNSIARFTPLENYLAMLRAAADFS